MQKYFNGAKAEEQMAMTVAQVGMAIPASQQLGLQYQQQQYSKRLQALIDPEKYARGRAAAFQEMTEAVDNTFAEAMEKYLATKMPPDAARKFALQAANNESMIQRQILEANYPTGANVVGINRQVDTANTINYPGGVPRRGAPARRKSARRKSARRR